MKQLFPILLGAALGWAQSRAAVEAPASIEGRVVSAVTGLPLSKVKVQIAPSFGQLGETFRYRPTLDTLTDATGSFIFRGVDPGSYSVSAERASYAKLVVGSHWQGHAGSSTALAAGDRLSGAVLKMQPQGLIAGTVLAADGKPLIAASVRLWRVGYEFGNKVLRQLEDFPVESDGSFVVGRLVSGRYYVAAFERATVPMQLSAEIRQVGLANTYYPNTLKFGSAAPLDIQSGKEIRDIRLTVQETGLRRLAGKTLNPVAGAVVKDLSLSLCVKNPLGGLTSLKGPERLVKATGSFAFNRVSPGDYVVWGSTKVEFRGETKTFYTRQSVHLDGVGPTRVDVVFTPLVTLRGTAHGVDGSQMVASLTDSRSFAGDFVKIAADGSFALHVPPGDYRFFAGNGTQRARAARSILFQGREVLQAPLHVTAAGGALEVFFAPAGGISGVVRGEDGQPIAGATVALWRSGFVMTAVSDAVGRFSLSLVPAGSFRLAAWDEQDPGLAEVPEVHTAFGKQSVEIKVLEGGLVVANLQANLR